MTCQPHTHDLLICNYRSYLQLFDVDWLVTLSPVDDWLMRGAGINGGSTSVQQDPKFRHASNLLAWKVQVATAQRSEGSLRVHSQTLPHHHRTDGMEVSQAQRAPAEAAEHCCEASTASTKGEAEQACRDGQRAQGESLADPSTALTQPWQSEGDMPERRQIIASMCADCRVSHILTHSWWARISTAQAGTRWFAADCAPRDRTRHRRARILEERYSSILRLVCKTALPRLLTRLEAAIYHSAPSKVRGVGSITGFVLQRGADALRGDAGALTLQKTASCWNGRYRVADFSIHRSQAAYVEEHTLVQRLSDVASSLSMGARSTLPSPTEVTSGDAGDANSFGRKRSHPATPPTVPVGASSSISEDDTSVPVGGDDDAGASLSTVTACEVSQARRRAAQLAVFHFAA